MTPLPIHPRDIIAGARARGETCLSEHLSKRVLAAYGVPVTLELQAANARGAVDAALEVGFPLVLKGNAPGLAHKTEAGLVEVGLNDEAAVAAAARRILKKMGPSGGLLVQEMVKGSREFLLGMTRDAQFGPCVSFGLGGIFAEALNDVTLRLAPLTMAEADAMLDGIRAAAMLGPYRGLPPVDRQQLCRALVGLGRVAVDYPEIAEIDVNPVIIAGSRPVAVDALIVLSKA